MTPGSTVFVWEALTAGACGDPLPTSLLKEGRAMWRALVTDLLRIDNWQVASVWHPAAGDVPIETSERLRITSTDNSAMRSACFDRLAAECDHTWVIAPEMDGLLVERLQRVVQLGGRIVGPDKSATQLCADKWQLAQHLRNHGITTPATAEFADERMPELPAVIKRRDGAGSCDCRLICSAEEWRRLITARKLSDNQAALIVQPFVAGRAISVAAIIAGNQQDVEIFPAGRQLLADDGTFAYRGGEIPWHTGSESQIGDLIRQTVAVIPGLKGYVGFDLQLRDDETGPVLIEINPRLTTAYVGYRQLTSENIASRSIAPEEFPQPIAWQPGSVRFTPGGQCIRNTEAL